MVPPLGWKTASPDPISSGKENRSSSSAELAVVPALGLLQPVEVLGQGLVRLPGRAVDTLELLALLVAAPVGPGHPHQGEMAQPAGRGNVGSPAQVSEGRRVPVGGDLGCLTPLGRGVHLVMAGTDGLDDLPLERLVVEEGEPFVDGVLVTDERLVLGHDLPHGGGDPIEVLVAEVGPSGQFEVVVEAVLDHRSDGEVGPGPQAEDGLGQYVGGGVTQHGPPGVGLGGDDADLGTVGQRGVEVDLLPVERGGHRRPGQAGTDGPGELDGRRARVELLGGSIGKSDGDGCHGVVFLHRVAGMVVGCGTGPGPPPEHVDRAPAAARTVRRPDAPGVPDPGRCCLQGNAQQGRAPADRAPCRRLLVQGGQSPRRVEVVVEDGPAPAPGPPRRGRLLLRLRLRLRLRWAGWAPPASPPADGPPGACPRHPTPSRSGSGGPAGPGAAPPAPTPSGGRRRRPDCPGTWTSWCRPARPGPRGASAGRTAVRSPTRTGPSRTRGGGTPGRAHRRGRRWSPPAPAAPGPSTRCASPGRPGPHRDSHEGSSGSDGCQSTKSSGCRLFGSSGFPPCSAAMASMVGGSKWLTEPNAVERGHVEVDGTAGLVGPARLEHRRRSG